MNYMKLFYGDLINGEGCRITIFVAGCSHACIGCHNKKSWNPKAGKIFDAVLREEIYSQLKDYTGITVTGGDPLHKRNLAEVIEFIKEAKIRFPSKDVWIWTGSLFKDIPKEIIDNVDVIIDGKYDIKLATNLQPWRGSSNQILWRKSKGIWEKLESDNKQHKMDRR